MKKRGSKESELHPRLVKFLEWFERFTERIIPFLLIALAILLILENPFWTLVHLEDYEPWVIIFDGFVVGFFVIDLIFKWFKVRKVLKFLRLYWLDIFAVFPFFLLTRVYLRFATLLRIGAGVGEVQKIAHEAVLVREARIIRQTELLKETKFLRQLRPVARLVRVLQRLLRLLKGRAYFAKLAAIKTIRRK